MTTLTGNARISIVNCIFICTILFGVFYIKSCNSDNRCNKYNKQCELNVKNLMRDVVTLQMKNRIKKNILDQLGLQVAPANIPDTERQERTLSIQPENFSISSTAIKSNINELLIVSEPPDNFTDKNIIKFQPQLVFVNRPGSQQSAKMIVKSANLLIRVKRKRKSLLDNTSKEVAPNVRSTRRRRVKVLSLTVSTVDESGKPDKKVATVKTPVGKSKWFNVSLPSSLIQNMIDKHDASLLLHIKCRRCRKNAEVILVHGSRRRRRHLKSTRRGKSRRSRSRRAKSKINKSRPILIVLTFMEQSAPRSKRSSRMIQGQTSRHRNRERGQHRYHRRRAPVCSSRRRESRCCREPFYFDFREVGWADWIVAPRGFNTTECMGTCQNRPTNSTSEMSCRPYRQRPLAILYLSDSRDMMYRELSDMIVTDCACQSPS